MSRKISQEDQLLWETVTKGVKRLRSNIALAEPIKKKHIKPQPRHHIQPAALVPLRKLAPVVKEVALPLRRKLKRGAVAPQLKLDLHGYTKESAYTQLLQFLTSAQQSGVRVVIVVTGKGGYRQSYDELSQTEKSTGVLRKAVPLWLKEAPFSSLISAYGIAAQIHGGEGAFYVQLRRLKKR